LDFGFWIATARVTLARVAQLTPFISSGFLPKVAPSCREESKIQNTKYKIVGNIPYYLTSYLFRLLLELEKKPEIIVLMIQKEVAQRIVAQPPHMNLLAVSIQFFAKPEIIAQVPKTAFYPQPKVDSAIIKLTPIPVIAIRQLAEKPCPPKLQRRRESYFFKVVKAGFSHPRKLLISNLNQTLKIPKEQLQDIFFHFKLKSNIRPSELSIFDWLNLTKNLLSFISSKN
jgi:16S rRNA (adenine1518-N6/adenine1519-N6)-dimethyltransferase